MITEIYNVNNLSNPLWDGEASRRWKKIIDRVWFKNSSIRLLTDNYYSYKVTRHETNYLAIFKFTKYMELQYFYKYTETEERVKIEKEFKNYKDLEESCLW